MSMKSVVAGTWSAIRILTCCYPPVPFSFSFLSWHDTALFWLSSFSNYSFSAGFLLSAGTSLSLASAFFSLHVVWRSGTGFAIWHQLSSLYAWYGDRALALRSSRPGFQFYPCCILTVWPPILTRILSELRFLFCKLRAVPFFRIIGRITRNRIFRIGLSWWTCCLGCHFWLVSSTWSHPVLYLQIPSLNFWFLILFPRLGFLLPLCVPCVCTSCMSYWYFRVFLSDTK